MYVKFVKGLAANRFTYQNNGEIYFATDERVIYMGGIKYGVQEKLEDALDEALIGSSVIFEENSGTLTFQTIGGTPVTVTLTAASNKKSGLMTATDKQHLDEAYEAVSAGGAIEDAIQEVQDQIDNMNLDSVTGIITSVSQSSGQVSATKTSVGQGLELTNDLHVKVAASNKILTTNVEGIVSTLSIDYVKNYTDGKTFETATPVILLKGIDDVVISAIDISELMVDGMLENATVDDEDNLVITMNTAAGSKTFTIPLAKYIDVYTAGNGISVSNKVISAKVKDADNYLEVTENGIASKNIDAAIKVETDRAIGVEGSLREKIEALEVNIGDESVEDQIEAALKNLDLQTTGGTGKYIQSISQEEGQVTAVAGDLTAANISATPIKEATTVQGIFSEIAQMLTWTEA